MTTLLPSGAGWQLSHSALRHCRPAPTRSRARKAGLSSAKGKKAAPTSWTKPGRVNGSDQTAPPGRACASRTRTFQPARASVAGAVSPFGPAPITTASIGSSALASRGSAGAQEFLPAADAQQPACHPLETVEIGDPGETRCDRVVRRTEPLL